MCYGLEVDRPWHALVNGLTHKLMSLIHASISTTVEAAIKEFRLVRRICG